MAATTVTRALINDTDANFRLWGKAISDQFTAGGWTKITDSGQIDWATVAKPAGTNASQGYEVWSSNDSGGGLNVFYVKIEYGSAGTAATQPAIWLTVGWASDGAGALTGIISTRKQLATNGTATGTLYNCYLAAGAGWAAMALGTAATFAFTFSIERTRNSSLAVQNEVLIMANATTGATPFSQVVTSTTAYTAAAVSTIGSGSLEGTLIPPNAANSIANGIVGLGLLLGAKGYLTNPAINVMLASSGQLGLAGSTISITTYGASHTYTILPPIGGLIYGAVSVASLNSLLRYE